MGIKVDLREIRRLERRAAQIGKVLLPPLRRAANVIRAETRQRIKASPVTDASKIASRYVKTKAIPREAKVLVYVTSVGIFFNKGTSVRQTRRGLNRGRMNYNYGWLVAAYEARFDEVKKAIESNTKKILL